MSCLASRDLMMWLILLAAVLVLLTGCHTPVAEETVGPSVRVLTYDDLGGGINAAVIELVDTEEQFLVVRNYDNSIAIQPLGRSRDVQRISQQQDEMGSEDGDAGR